MTNDIDAKKFPIGLNMFPKRMPPQRIAHTNLIRRYAILQNIRKEEGPEITQERLDEIDKMLLHEQRIDSEFRIFNMTPGNTYDKWNEHIEKWKEENKEKLSTYKYHDTPLWGWQP